MRAGIFKSSPKAVSFRRSTIRPVDDMTRESVRIREVNEQLVLTALRVQVEATHARALLENLPDVIARFDLALRHTYVNPAIEAMTGVPSWVFLGKRHDELNLPPNLAKAWSSLLHEALATGTPAEALVAVNTPAGPRSFQLRAIPEHGMEPEVESLVTIARDVTDSRLYQQAVEDAQRLRRIQEVTAALSTTRSTREIARVLLSRARASIEASGGVVLLHDPSFDVLRLEATLGCSADAIERWNLVPMAARSPLAAAARTREPLVLDTLEGMDAEYPELADLRAQGDRALVVIPLVVDERSVGVLALTFLEPRPLASSDLEFLALVAIHAAHAFDRARLDRAERHARREAEHANRLKDDFLATMSHELRTPLNAVVGWSAILRDHPGDLVQLQRGLAAIERNARAQARLVDDILDVTRITSGKLYLRKERVDAASLVLTALDDMRPYIESKGITVRSTIERGVMLYADPTRIQQIAWNLVSNAAKFTPEGGRIEIDLASIGSIVRLEVRDTGIGIPASFLPRIYDRFRQLDGSSTRSHGGLGLGLAIVHHLVDVHGGTIVATSDGVGLGAKFTVELPVLSPLEIPVGPRTPSQIPPPVEPWQGSTLDGVRILIVDDDEDGCEILSMALSSLGAITESATHAVDALARIERSAPDILVCDIGMPDIDGFGLIGLVRALPSLSRSTTPAIAVSGFARQEDQERALSAGFAAHLPKPVDLGLLVTTIIRFARRV